MGERKQPTPPPDVSQKPQPPPKPPEPKRTAFEFLRDLLRDAAWYRSAIELDLYGENPQDGESLRREAEEIVLSEVTRRVNEELEDDYIQGGKTYDLVNLMSGSVPMMPVPRCDSCRWWGPAGLCRLLSTRGTTRSQVDATVEDGSSLADARGHYGYGADFVTSADFGCIQWEAKE